MSVAPLTVERARVLVEQDGRRFPALVVRPREEASGAYPVVAFGHGFLQGPGRYLFVLEGLAARGYVVVAPASATGPLPSHGRFADDLGLAVRWARRTEPGAHPSACAVMGHSMGGGTALLAAERNPWINAVATCAAAQTRPSSVAAAANLTVPTLFVVGSQDRIVRPATTRRMYAVAPSPATFASVRGGFHCGFLDNTVLRGLGCDSGDLARGDQLEITTRLLGDWLDATLLGTPVTAWPEGVDIETHPHGAAPRG